LVKFDQMGVTNDGESEQFQWEIDDEAKCCGTNCKHWLYITVWSAVAIAVDLVAIGMLSHAAHMTLNTMKKLIPNTYRDNPVLQENLGGILSTLQYVQLGFRSIDVIFMIVCICGTSLNRAPGRKICLWIGRYWWAFVKLPESILMLLFSIALFALFVHYSQLSVSPGFACIFVSKWLLLCGAIVVCIYVSNRHTDLIEYIDEQKQRESKIESQTLAQVALPEQEV